MYITLSIILEYAVSVVREDRGIEQTKKATVIYCKWKIVIRKTRLKSQYTYLHVRTTKRVL